MKTLSIRDIIGPVMVGPSSSHTAGALRISLMTRGLLSSAPKSATFKLYGSFAHTYQGHGTDKALIAGLLGKNTDDLAIRDSFTLAQEAGLSFSFVPMPNEITKHSNTVDIEVTDAQGKTVLVRGESIGGGVAHITRLNGVEVLLDGQFHSLVIRQHDVPGVLAHITACLNHFNINIATTRLFREHKGQTAYTIIETDEAIPSAVKDAILASPSIFDVCVVVAGNATGEMAPVLAQDEALQSCDIENANAKLSELDFENGEALLAYCEANKLPLSKAMCQRERYLLRSQGIASDDTRNYLREVVRVMRASIQSAQSSPKTSMGGLIGGEAQKLTYYQAQENPLCDNLLGNACTYAMAVLETNASMGRIVAAPTAGSAGVIPAMLFCLQDRFNFDDERLVDALANASAIGFLIAKNACVSGAEGGCQAEIGSAAAMAASCAVELLGGSPRQCFDAASNVIANMLGLVCDPIAGLVEAPCQKRNASGVANALVGAQIALAGIGNLVPFDQTVEAMRRVGNTLPFELKESALGGMATTPAACEYCSQKGLCQL